MREFEVALPDGRTLAAVEAGDPDGAVVIYHHGTPTSKLLDPLWVADAEQRGIRLVGYDRPGYGGSSRDAERTVASCAADVAVLADALGAPRFATWGVSGGGPHALACAALLPDRVSAAASVAGVGPYGVDGLDFLAGMGQDNLDEFAATLDGAGPLRDHLEPARLGLLATTPAGIAEELASLLPPVDRVFLDRGAADHLHESMVAGLRDGVDGWLDDDLAFAAPWGFDLTMITVPVLVLQGDQDLMVPFAHGQWLAGAVPDATVWLRPGEGHLSLLAEIGDVHAWLTSPDGV